MELPFILLACWVHAAVRAREHVAGRWPCVHERAMHGM